MATKTLQGRIVNKHDSAANWAQAVNFRPMQGELIIYDPDETCSYVRFKIGDGVQNVNALPFANDGFISYNEQTLTDEQKAQARANIDKFKWRTFSDSWGTYTYALAPEDDDKYELAQTITNISNNGSISALEDIVSWLYSFVSTSIHLPNSSSEMIENVVKNYEVLRSNEVFTTINLYFKENNYNDYAGTKVMVSTTGKKDPSHIVQVDGIFNDLFARFFYNIETNITTEETINRRYADATLSKVGYYADAIATGEAISNLEALVGDTSVAEQINNAIVIATDDEILKLLAQEDMLPVVTDTDGSILADENENILLW